MKELVSVIIPCYNQGHYLAEAIRSVQAQSYPQWEIIVVDDGSTDATADLAQGFAELVYVYQENRGLSAARNTGIRHSKGEYLVFLDSDDVLLPAAIESNLERLKAVPEAAFISGGHQKTDEELKKVLETVQEPVQEKHYQALLQGNYIGMHATVMYRRWVFDEFMFDESLRACEDYDLYLRLAARYPVLHQTGLLALYRQHTSNMSGDLGHMLNTVLAVLDRQQASLRSAELRRAYRKGCRIWKEYYGLAMYKQLVWQRKRLSAERLAAYKATLRRHMPGLYIKQWIKSQL